jgi:hypothetical protein
LRQSRCSSQATPDQFISCAPAALTPDHTYLRLNQDEYFQPFFRGYLELLTSNLKQIPVMDHAGNFHHSYYPAARTMT